MSTSKGRQTTQTTADTESLDDFVKQTLASPNPLLPSDSLKGLAKLKMLPASPPSSPLEVSVPKQKPNVLTRWKWHKNTRNLGGHLNTYLGNSDTFRSGDDASIDGPLGELWKASRVHPIKSRKGKENMIFNDSWVLREFMLQRSVNPNSPFPRHVSIEHHFSKDALTVMCIAQDNSGRMLGVGTQGGSIHLYQLSEGQPLGVCDDKPVAILTGHTAGVSQLLLLDFPEVSRSPFVVSISLDRTLKIWEAAEPKPIAVVRTSDIASSIAVHPTDPSLLFVGCLDATVQIWRIQVVVGDQEATTSQMVAKTSIIDYIRIADVVTCVTISPDARFLAIGLLRGRVVLHNAQTLKFIREFDFKTSTRRWRGGGKKVTGIQWASNSCSFISTLHDSTVRMTDISGMARLKNLEPREELDAEVLLSGHSLQHLLIPAQFAAGGSRIVSASEDNSICCWDLADDTKTKCSKIRMHGELCTYILVGSENFNLFLINEVHRALKDQIGASGQDRQVSWPEDQDPCLNDATTPMAKASDALHNPGFMSLWAGCYDGSVKLFVNFGLTSKLS